MRTLSADDKARMLAEAREKARRDKEVYAKDAREEGREEGRGEGVREVARNLLKTGLSVELIAQATGLTRQEIAALHAH